MNEPPVAAAPSSVTSRPRHRGVWAVVGAVLGAIVGVIVGALFFGGAAGMGLGALFGAAIVGILAWSFGGGKANTVPK